MSAEFPPIPRRSVLVLATIIAALVVVRLPVIDRQPGGHDEEFYAVPGLTVLEDGVPRLPHVPQRDPSRVFYRADVAFFAEPPLYFYVQALFYAVLPHEHGTARLPSLIAGCFAIVMVYLLARRWYGDETIALWSAGVYSLLRMFYFTAIFARPDLICTLLGLTAIYSFDRWRAEEHRRWFVATGVLIGLGGLTHPFAIVYAVQLAVWAFWIEHRWRRFATPLLLAMIAIATCSLWLPLILAYPEEFQAQFGNNIVNPAGGGLMERLFSPWAAIAWQAHYTWDRAAPIQFCLSLAGVLAAAVLDLRRRGARKPVLFAIATICLITMFVGEHSGFGYWSYTAAFFAMCLSSIGLQCWRWMLGPAAQRFWISIPAGVLAVLIFVPGLGLRTTWAYLTHWNDIEYDAPRFAERIMADLPADARYMVGIEYLLDFYASGRQTVIGETQEFYFNARDVPYDYLVVSHDGLGLDLPELMNGRLLRTYGRPDDLFACYAEVYVPAQPPE